MRLGRWIGEVRGMHRAFADLLTEDRLEEQRASYELAVTARDFSHKTKQVVDDKLVFTAALMRAGEVDAANRVFAEMERDVREEEAALMERVSEVRAARAARRAGLSRMRMARLVVAGMIGSVLLMSSALGMTLVKTFSGDDGDRFVAASSRSRSADSLRTGAAETKRVRMKPVKVAGVKVLMSPAQLREYRRLVDSGVDPRRLESFLITVLGPTVAAEISNVIAAATAAPPPPPPPAESVAVLADQVVKKAKKKAAKKTAAREQQAPKESPEESPSPEPQPSPDPSPSDSNEGDEDPPGQPVPLPGDDETSDPPTIRPE